MANRANDLKPLAICRTGRNIAEQLLDFSCRKVAVMVSIVHHLPLSTGLPAMTSLRRDQSVELYVSRNRYSLLGSLRRIDGRSFVSILAKSAQVLFLIIKFYSFVVITFVFPAIHTMRMPTCRSDDRSFTAAKRLSLKIPEAYPGFNISLYWGDASFEVFEEIDRRRIYRNTICQFPRLSTY